MGLKALGIDSPGYRSRCHEQYVCPRHMAALQGGPRRRDGLANDGQVQVISIILRVFGADLQDERAELEDLSEFIREGRNLEVLAAEVEPLADRVAQARPLINKRCE